MAQEGGHLFREARGLVGLEELRVEQKGQDSPDPGGTHGRTSDPGGGLMSSDQRAKMHLNRCQQMSGDNGEQDSCAP